MLYLIIIFALWRIVRRAKVHCALYPYTATAEQEPAQYAIDDYILPPYSPKDEAPARNYYNEAEISRLEAQKQEYMTVLDCIEQEQADLKAEYQQSGVKRRAAISSRLTTLASKHAATNRTLSNIDSKIEKLYQ